MIQLSLSVLSDIEHRCHSLLLHRCRQKHSNFLNPRREMLARNIFAGFSKRRCIADINIRGAMKLRQRRKKTKMKTRNSLITLGAVAVAAITLNLNASAASLSPRAAGNEIIHTAGTNNEVNPVALGLTTEYAAPRLAGNRGVTVAGTNLAVNPSTLCSQNMTACPKAIQACAANPLAPMPCCTVAAK